MARMKKTTLLIPAFLLATGLALTGCTPGTETVETPAPTESATVSPADGLDLPPDVPLLTENIIPASFEKTDTGWTATFTGDIAEVPERVLSAMEADGWTVSSDEATKTYSGENDTYTVVFTPIDGDASGGTYIVTITKK